VTAPAELNVNDPKLVVIPAPPTVIDVALKLALFVTAKLVDPSVMAPVEVNLKLFAVFVPARAVFESSWIVTAPVELIVSEPKLVVVPGLPTVIDVPRKLALFVTARLVDPSVIAPAEVRFKLSAVFAPDRAVLESSWIVTAPVELNLSEPKLVVVPAPPIAIDVPPKLALFVTARLVDPSVIAPVEVTLRLFAVFAPAKAVLESSWTVTTPAELNVSDPKFVVVPAPPIEIDVPLKAALFVTARLVEPSVIAPVDVRDKLFAVFAPDRAVPESS
jgi:hypothetical protein